MTLVNIADYAAAARERLDRAAYEYYAGGALDELTLHDNSAAYRRIGLRYRVLAGVREPDLRTTLLGREVAMPIAVAPTAFHKMAHPDGELGTARAAGAAGALFVLSGLSNTAMEEVFAAATGPRFFQLYIYKDRGVTRELVARAEAAGAEAIVLTVDTPVWGIREADLRNNFMLPAGLSVENLSPAGKADFPAGEGSGLANYVANMLDGGLSWEDLDWLCSITELPVLVKGVCVGEDGALAAAHGAAGVIVSNHGGRQLDGCPATVDVLPEVVAAVDGRAEVYVDGGIRRGGDVFKALTLGARAVLVGRPILWGLAVAGEAGVTAVLDILRREFADTMSLCGCSEVSEIGSEFLDDRCGQTGRT